MRLKLLTVTKVENLVSLISSHPCIATAQVPGTEEYGVSGEKNLCVPLASSMFNLPNIYSSPPKRILILLGVAMCPP